uniref:Uncharacterized protein n=1 Tax=Astyanax mexicanus TaxID=7994 RepID=A0A3B1JYR4_ASTMX
PLIVAALQTAGPLGAFNYIFNAFWHVLPHQSYTLILDNFMLCTTVIRTCSSLLHIYSYSYRCGNVQISQNLTLCVGIFHSSASTRRPCLNFNYLHYLHLHCHEHAGQCSTSLTR